jgi:Family of unknown function (DUF5681)
LKYLVTPQLGLEETVMPKKRSRSEIMRYDVGYARPPKQYQFKRGRSGNPAGINRTTARSDLKTALERELAKKIKIRRDLVATQGDVGIRELVRQFVKGEPRARRDLLALADRVGVDLAPSKTIENALAEAVSAEDEALLAEYVEHHRGLRDDRDVDDVRRLPKPEGSSEAEVIEAEEKQKMLGLPKLKGSDGDGPTNSEKKGKRDD